MSAEMDSDHEEKRHKKSKRKHRHEEQGDKMDVDEEPKATETPKKEKKKHKEKKRKERTEDAETKDVEAEPAASPEKKHKKHKSSDKKEKKSKHHKSTATPEKTAARAERNDEVHEAFVPDPKQYPFFTQTFSQRIPVWPAAFDEPLTKTARECLDPMLNRYSPKFKGVLLAYKNANLSERPRRADPQDPPTDDTPVVLESIECYAPPFAWLTADLHLFIPSRGAWMEGVINLQSEGHIGVVCFDKFNASISRRSLPKGWTWVDQPEEEEPEPVTPEEDPFVEGQEQAGEGEDGKKAEQVPQLRSSGYWLDRNGQKVTGKIYFRIKNFSSGSTGDYTYLSLQGTMLDDEAERESVAEEKAIEKARRARQSPGGLLYPTMRLPEFSMTRLKDESI
jgi:DNA-directed RNA polymerase I subunit RPA43